MKKLLINTGLFVLAIIIIMVAAPLGLFFTIIRSIERGMQGKEHGVNGAGVAYAADRILANGLALDIFGGVINKDIFDWLFLKTTREGQVSPGGIPFGIQGMSISGVIGLNAEMRTLSTVGRGLRWLLDVIDPDHCAKAAENNRLLIHR